MNACPECNGTRTVDAGLCFGPAMCPTCVGTGVDPKRSQPLTVDLQRLTYEQFCVAWKTHVPRRTLWSRIRNHFRKP